MKELYLIRHAKSSWSDHRVHDMERKLNKRGKRDAPFMAEKLSLRTAGPGIIISSPAKRAKKTAIIMAEGVGYDTKHIVFDEAVYHSSAEGLLKIVNAIGNKYTSAFLIGHNFAITDLAQQLTGEIIGNIPTSGIVAMACDAVGWGDITFGCCKMKFFDYPKKYKELQ